MGIAPTHWKIGIKDLFDVFLGLNSKMVDPKDNYRDKEEFSPCANLTSKGVRFSDLQLD